jgi:hypothetical protein
LLLLQFVYASACLDVREPSNSNGTAHSFFSGFRGPALCSLLLGFFFEAVASRSWGLGCSSSATAAAMHPARSLVAEMPLRTPRRLIVHSCVVGQPASLLACPVASQWLLPSSFRSHCCPGELGGSTVLAGWPSRGCSHLAAPWELGGSTVLVRSPLGGYLLTPGATLVPGS